MKRIIDSALVKRMAFDLVIRGLAYAKDRDRDPHVFPWRLTPSIDEADLGMLP